MTCCKSVMRQGRGFTLIEVIAVIVILGIIGGVSSSLILANVASFTDSAGRIQLHGQASIALDRLVREFREIDPDSDAGPPAPNISQASTAELHWSNSHSLRLNSEALLLNTDGVHEDALCEGVSDFALDYMDESNQSLLVNGVVPQADLKHIQRIAIHLGVSSHGMTESLTTRVFLREAMTGGMP